ncbi:hypothetical protein COY20_04000, partial [Candidatus Shapirobacteria bacterium CG_4_10_14_0_2_um_filter_40_12]
SLFFLVFAVFTGVVLLPKLAQLSVNFDYYGLITSICFYIYSNSNTQNFTTAIFLIVFFLFIIITKFI